MKRKLYIGMIAMLLANSMAAMNGMAYLQTLDDWFETVTVTPTNLVFRLKGGNPEGSYLWLVAIQSTYEGYIKDTHLESNVEESRNFILPMGCTIGFAETAHGRKPFAVRFTPVIFKNQMDGFRITELRYFGTDIRSVAYVALSDIPVEVGEEDVEKVMLWKRDEVGRLYGGEWKTPEEARQISLTELTAEPQPYPEGEGTGDTETAEPLTSCGGVPAGRGGPCQ